MAAGGGHLAGVGGDAGVRRIGSEKGFAPVRQSSSSDVLATAEARLPGTRRVVFTSAINGRRYAISLARPLLPEPPSGVLYVLDGDNYFATVVEAVRANLNAPNVVVVGVGYPDDDASVTAVLARRPTLPDWLRQLPPKLSYLMVERLFDLTLPASDQTLMQESIPGGFVPTSADIGGLDGFLDVMSEEVRPLVAEVVPSDPDNQAIFGHSLGGLAVLHALFTRPSAYRTFIAASPSIWWDGCAVLRNEASFAATVASGEATPRILITVGEDEGIPPKALYKFGIDPDAYEAVIRSARMVENARDLARRLNTLKGHEGYLAKDCAVFPKQSHGLSPWPAIGRAVSFAFPEQD